MAPFHRIVILDSATSINVSEILKQEEHQERTYHNFDLHLNFLCLIITIAYTHLYL